MLRFKKHSRILESSVHSSSGGFVCLFLFPNVCFPFLPHFPSSLLGEQRGPPCFRAEPPWKGCCSRQLSSPHCLERHLPGKMLSGQHCRGEPLAQQSLWASSHTATPGPWLCLPASLLCAWPPEGITDHRKAALCAPQPLPPLLLRLRGFALPHQGKGG